MKRVVKSKHFQRGALFLVSLLILVGVIFVFTRPLLAPESGDNSLKNASNLNAELENSTFQTNNDELLPQGIGEGVQANSFLVYDELTGTTLAAHNPNAPVAIASLTKLMTAYTVQKYGQLDDEWVIASTSKIGVRPVLGLETGDKVVVKDLVDAMLVGSANDAASSLGEYLQSATKQPAIKTMNQEAKQLGMTSTNYENPIGFDSEQNYSTAADLKKLLVVIRPIKLFTDIDRKQSYSFTSELGKTYSVKATNTLLAGDEEIHAVKTGYTNEAQGAMITAIVHNDKRFIIIVLNSPDREGDTKLLKSQVLKTTLL